eukprot:167265-Chlamydomonas_euryale.AAC.2
MRPVLGRFGHPSLYSSTHHPERKTQAFRLSVTSSSLPESLNAGKVTGCPTTTTSVFAALIPSPYFEAIASTMPKRTSKSSGESASNAKWSSYISVTIPEICRQCTARLEYNLSTKLLVRGQL